MDDKRTLVKNALSGWVTLAVSIPATLIITPFVVGQLDRELYGVWSWLNGLLIYTDLLYFGLGSAIIKNVAQLRAKQDVTGVARLTSVVISIYGTLGLICFGALFWIGTALTGLLAEPLSDHAASQALVTCALLGLQLFFTFVGSAFSGLICGHDRYYLNNIVSVVVVCVRLAGILALVRSNNNPLVYLALVTSASAATQTLFLAAIGLRLLRGATIRPARPTLDELRFLYGFGVQAFFVMFAVRLISYTDTTVVGLMLGASSVALYAPPQQLLEQARGAIAALSAVLLPRVTTLAARGQTGAIRDLLISTARVTNLMAGWFGALGMTLGPAFLDRWLGEGFGGPVQWVLVYLAIAMFCQNISTHGPLAFYQALHLLRRPAIVLFAEGLLNLALSIWLAPRLGITGVALATVIPTILLTTSILPLYLCRYLELPIRRYVVEAIGPGVLVLLATLAVQWITGLVIDSRSYVSIGARALASLPVVYLIFRATFPPDQQHEFWRYIGLSRATSQAAEKRSLKTEV